MDHIKPLERLVNQFQAGELTSFQFRTAVGNLMNNNPIRRVPQTREAYRYTRATQ